MPAFADVPITDVMTPAPFTARADATVDALVALITEHRIGCVPIVDERGRPAGIVTKLDLVECLSDGRTTAREIMMPHAMTIGRDASLATAASLMHKEGFHHLLVVDADRVLVGLVSTFDITRWVATR